MKIITNNHARDLICFADLTAKEQKEFDYLEEDEHYTPQFFRYKGNAYDVNEFMRATAPEFKGWEGFRSDTFFSGTLVKYANDYESVIVGRWYC